MNNEALAANIRRYANNYKLATEAGHTMQARVWLKRYEQAVAVLGFDPLS